MSLYYFIKKLLLSFLLKSEVVLKRFNLNMWYRRKIKSKIKKFKPPKLSNEQKRLIKEHYASRGFKAIQTYWHEYYGGFNGQFSTEYIPEDLFHATIAMAINPMEQWPALLDKNLSDTFFKEVKQPQTIIKNINGIFLKNDVMITSKEAASHCAQSKEFVIKPSLHSGGGESVIKCKVLNGRTDYKDNTIEDLFKIFDRDFVVQEVVQQHAILAKLNASSVNTIRLLTYLRDDGVHVLSSHIRIGKMGSFVDNSSSGGISCGILENGQLKPYGFIQAGTKKFKTESGVELKSVVIPAYSEVKALVKQMHYKVPYFKLIAWDFAINSESQPVFIEYNTYRMGISSMQLASGPLFNEFFDELLELGRQHLQNTKLF